MDLERAEELLRQGRYADAVDRFRELLSHDPERAELRGRVAEAYRLAGNPERAFHHFHKASSLFVRQHNLLGAARMLEAANQVSPNEPDVLYRLAEVLKSLGKERALRSVLKNLVKAASAPGDRRRLWALDELVQLAPNDFDSQVDRAKALLEVGRVREAVIIWKQVSDHLAARGVDFAPWLQRAAETEPDRLEVGVNLCQILLKHQRHREALALLVPYYEKFPDDVDLLTGLVVALKGLGAKEKILPAQLELLKARTRSGQRTEALEELRQLLQAHPRDPRVLEVSAHACAAFGLTGEACRLWFDLATLYDQHAMAKERDRVVLRVLETKPDHEGALSLGARVLRNAGRAEEAASLEARLAEVQSRSFDELPAQPMHDSDPPTRRLSTAELPAAPKPQLGEAAVTHAGPRGQHTMVLSDADVLDEQPAMPSASNASAAAALADAFSDDTATGEVIPANPSGATQVRPPSGVRRRDLRDPIEAPEAPEEATSRMDDMMSAELDALRHELEGDEKAPAGRPAARRRAAPRLVSDLLAEMSLSKKR